MSWLRSSRLLKSLFAGVLIAVFATLGSSAHAIFENQDRDAVYIFDSGLACKFKVAKPWQNFTSIFGFSSIVYQEAKANQDQRAMLGFVITPFDGVDLSAEASEKEFAEFRKAKAEYVREEGGTFIGAAESMAGVAPNGAKGIYRISVKYRLGDENLKDSTYFFLVRRRLVHAKALFAYTEFDEAVIEKQILDLLASVQCRE